MEPLSAFSAAAGVIQLVDFTSRLLSQSHEIYKSSTGELGRNSDLTKVTENLVKLNRQLKASLSGREGKASDSSTGFARLLEDCSSVAEELQVALSKLKLQPDEKRQRWSSIQRGLRSIWTQDDIKSLEQRMESFRQAISMHLLVSLREQVMDLHENRPKMENSSKTREYPDEVAYRNTANLGNEFLRQIENNRQWQESVIDAIHQSYNEKSHSSQPVPVESAMDPILIKDLTKSLLKTLDFKEMSQREMRIPVAHEKTFKWLLHDDNIHASKCTRTWSSYPQWLQGSGQLYWITGRAGSGKSTLMKFIHSHFYFLLTQYLQNWAQGRTVISSNFFFWNSGSEIQMSQEGLLRTLLYECLLQCPDLVPRVFPHRWEAFRLFGHDSHPWSWSELLEGLDALLEQSSAASINLFFLIDGLDEFNGDHGDLIDLIHHLIVLPNVKVCVASRPWVIFEDAFNCRPSLLLHDLTKGDITRYISDKFSASAGYQTLQQFETTYANKLVEDITTKAHGVFLWVHLVVRSLLSGISSGDRISDLQSRLDSIPSDLEALFWKMLGQLSAEQFERASQLFQMIRTFDSLWPTTTLLELAFADEDDTVVFEFPVGEISESEAEARAEMMRRRINFFSRGLLEVTPGLSQASSPVQYLHRTVRDFLSSPEVWDKLLSHTKPPFNRYRAACKCWIMKLKIIKPATLEPLHFWNFPTRCIALANAAWETNGGSQSRLLEEVDKAAAQVASMPFKNGISLVQSSSPGTQDSHWSSTRNECYSSTSFLSLSVQLQLFPYVLEKLTANVPVIRVQERPLLFSAVCVQNFTVNTNSIDLYPSWPNPEVVELLLKSGSDPNEVVFNETIWERVLTRATGQNSSPKYVQSEFDIESQAAVREITKRIEAKKRANLEARTLEASNELRLSQTTKHWKVTRLSDLMEEETNAAPAPDPAYISEFPSSTGFDWTEILLLLLEYGADPRVAISLLDERRYPEVVQAAKQNLQVKVRAEKEPPGLSRQSRWEAFRSISRRLKTRPRQKDNHT